MTNNKYAWLFLIALLPSNGLLGEQIARADEPLVWKLAKGETLRYRRIQERPVTNTVGEREVRSQTDRTTDLTLTVTAVDAKGTADVTMKITRMKIKKTSPRGDAEFDSNDPKPATGEAQQLAETTRLLVGSEFAFKLTPQGAVENFELSAATKEKFKAIPALDAKSMQLLVPTIPVPVGAVSVNQEWTRADKLNLPGVGELKIDRKYKYLGPKVAEGLTQPEIGATLGVDLAQAKSPTAQVQIDDWTHEGTIRFDRKSGRLLSQKDKGRMKMTVKAGGQTIPTVGDTIETVTLLKDDE